MSFIRCHPFGRPSTQLMSDKTLELETARQIRISNMVVAFTIFHRLPLQHVTNPTVKIRGHLGSIVGDSVPSPLETRGPVVSRIDELTSF